MSESKQLNIFEKMLAATEKINRVAKNLSVGVGKSSYKAVGEADVLNAVKPIEVELGIYSYPVSRKIIYDNVFILESEYDGKKSEKNQFFLRLETIYRFVNTEKPSEFIDITTYGDGIDSQDKAVGKAMTYADKYALLKAYKIETGEDPDQFASRELYNNNDYTPKTATRSQKNTPNSVKTQSVTEDKQAQTEWVWASGRFKGLTMLASSEKSDFNDYINILKEHDKFSEDIKNEYERVSKFIKLDNNIEEVSI